MSQRLEEVIKAALLGALQGLTEFLPVSSSGHLVLFHHMLGFSQANIFFDIMLHVGTLGAILAVYRKSIFHLVKEFISGTLKYFVTRQVSSAQRMVGLLFIATIPTGIIGLLLNDQINYFFSQPKSVSLMLLVTASLLQLPRLRSRKPNQSKFQSEPELKVWHAFLIGMVQGLAVVPGISRSGATISTALLLGVRPVMAAEFSFLLSIPAILGAVVLKIGDISTVSSLAAVSVGIGTSFLIGLIALRLLLTLIAKAKFFVFSYYCLLVAIFAFFI